MWALLGQASYAAADQYVSGSENTSHPTVQFKLVNDSSCSIKLELNQYNRTLEPGHSVLLKFSGSGYFDCVVEEKDGNDHTLGLSYSNPSAGSNKINASSSSGQDAWKHMDSTSYGSWRTACETRKWKVRVIVYSGDPATGTWEVSDS